MNKFKKIIKDNWVLILGVAITLLYLYSKIFFDESILNFNNILYKFKPWSSINTTTSGPVLSDVADNLLTTIYKTFYSGAGFSFWNSTIGLGTTEDISTILNPLNYVYLLPMVYAVLIRSILKFLIAFFGMYFLMREFGTKKYSAAISGVIYTFSSALVMWHGWPHTDVAAFAPFAFLCVEKIIKEFKVSYSIWLSIILYIMLSAGMPTFAVYFMYLMGIYIVIRTLIKYWKDKKKIIIVFSLFGVGALLGIVTSWPYLSSLLSSVGSNGYTETRASYGSITLPFKYIRTMFYPYIKEGFTNHPNECTIYSGIFALYISFLTFIRYGKKKENKFWSVTALILLVLIFTHGLDFIYTKLPVANTSVKFRIIVLFNFVIAILAGFNLDDILRNINMYKSKLKYFLIAYIATMGIALKIRSILINNKEISSDVIKTITILTAIFITLICIVKFNKKVLLVALSALIVFDMAGFAKHYLPTTANNVGVVPEATDTIKYLQDNTKDGEKIVALGGWTLFANTNAYYGLNDIRSHNFINTNEDLQKYYKAIDPKMYATYTRTAISSIKNYNLLGYLGVKYVVSEDKGKIVNYLSDSDSLLPSEKINKNTLLKQSFVPKENNLFGIQLLLGTYARKFSKDDKLIVKLYDDSGNVIVNKEVSLSKAKDNQYLQIDFDSIKDSNLKKYTLEVTTNINEGISIYQSTEDSYKGTMLINNNALKGDIAIRGVYEYNECVLAHSGDDGLYTFELNNYSDKVQLIDNVVVDDNRKAMLKNMKSKYSKNTIFLTKKDYEKYGVKSSNSKLSDSEYVKVKENKDDYIKLDVNINEPRFLVLNQYYTDDWKVYVDGKETSLSKANYIMRGTYINKSGNHTVEFKYEPKKVYRTIYVSISGAVVIIIIIVFRKKIQLKINKIVEEEGCKK